jgi:glutamate 5-kinase
MPRVLPCAHYNFFVAIFRRKLSINLYQRIVVKVGTSTLTGGQPSLSVERITDLVQQLVALRNIGCQVVLVSSGAISAGRERLGQPLLPKAVPAKQMLAAVGQPRLMALYDRIFEQLAQPVAQVLLTRGDLTRRRSYLNARHTLLALLDQHIIPIINENDTVATEEIRVGDNDNLSALVANLVEADLLLLLTDQAGLFSADPRTNPQAQLLPEISSAEIPAAVWEAAGANGAQGTGGMHTKLQAAALARQSGVATVIAAGSEPQVLLRVARGEALGTRLPALVSALESRKRYILSGWDGQARVQVDAGAAAALARGSSLLPVGVAAVHGNFERGDTLAVLDAAGHELARGLANYAAGELRSISGQQSDQITALLGYEYGDEVIHRDHLVLLARPGSAL